MDQTRRPLEVKLWGDYACFTRPEMKVERVSYPVMTPSAARGALEAIFWKPEFTWTIQEIQVLRPIEYVSILRNEINHRQSQRAADGWARQGGGYNASNPRSRAQRHTLALRNVAYLVRANPVLKPGVQDDIAKYRDQFRRRVAAGRCFTMPYLGCREFAAYFAPPSADDAPIDRTEDLGLILLDIDYEKEHTGHGTPQFFHATLESGTLRVPDQGKEATAQC